jgi:hypothetical protein
MTLYKGCDGYYYDSYFKSPIIFKTFFLDSKPKRLMVRIRHWYSYLIPYCIMRKFRIRFYKISTPQRPDRTSKSISGSIRRIK